MITMGNFYVVSPQRIIDDFITVHVVLRILDNYVGYEAHHPGSYIIMITIAIAWDVSLSNG